MTPLSIAREEAERATTRTNLLTPKGFSAAYIRYRLLRPLLKFNYRLFRKKYGISPWTTQASIRTFDRLLTKEMKGLEYGSGMSTVYFAERLGHLTSVEHDAAWYRKVQGMLAERKLSHVDYHLIERQVPATDFQFPFEKFSLKKDAFPVRPEFASYFEFINTFDDQSFDFVLIDGRARVECCLLALSKIRSGGILALDNSDRSRYRPVFDYLKSWPSVTTTTGLFDTTLWFKP